MSSTIKAPEYGVSDLFKIVMIGTSGSGKTSLLLRFIENRFKESQICTIGVDFKIKTLSVDENPLKL